MNYYCEFFKEFKETTIQSILKDFSEKRIDKEKCLEKIVNYVFRVANAADDTVLKENTKENYDRADELEVYKKAYVNVCDRLEFYERRMFPLTAVSSAIFQRVFLEHAKKELEDES